MLTYVDVLHIFNFKFDYKQLILGQKYLLRYCIEFV